MSFISRFVNFLSTPQSNAGQSTLIQVTPTDTGIETLRNLEELAFRAPVKDNQDAWKSPLGCLQNRVLRFFGSTSRNRNPVVNVANLDESLSNGTPHCGICLSDIEMKHKAKLDGCLHRFHYKCILEWFHMNANCPMCRAPFSKIYKPEDGELDDSRNDAGNSFVFKTIDWDESILSNNSMIGSPIPQHREGILVGFQDD